MKSQSMQTVIVDLVNNKLTDECFTLETVDPCISWNVSRIWRDACAGRFGEAETFDVSRLPPPDYASGNLDLKKIERFKSIPEVLDIPILGIADPRGGVMCICDGQHRVTARWELKLRQFSIFIVPVEMEREYRILEIVS